MEQGEPKGIRDRLLGRSARSTRVALTRRSPPPSRRPLREAVGRGRDGNRDTASYSSRILAPRSDCQGTRPHAPGGPDPHRYQRFTASILSIFAIT
jgi:hypothetical protein